MKPVEGVLRHDGANGQVTLKKKIQKKQTNVRGQLLGDYKITLSLENELMHMGCVKS